MRKLKDLIDTVTERGYYVSEAYRLQKDVDSLSRRVRDYYGVPVGTYMGTPMLFAMLRSEPMMRRRVAKCGMYLQSPAEVEEQQRISALVSLLSDTLRRVCEEEPDVRYDIIERVQSPIKRELRGPIFSAMGDRATKESLLSIIRMAAKKLSKQELKEVLATELVRKIMED